MATYKELLKLTKSEIVLLEGITLVAGFFIALLTSQFTFASIDWLRLLLSFVGTCALALGAGALNQIQERQEDSQMERTKDRPLPSGRLSLTTAWTAVAVLFIAGVLLLSWVSLPILILGIIAVLSYNGLYTMWWKRKMAYAAIPGAIPGAIPILIGYQAALIPGSNEMAALFDPRGLYLFAILFFWQMPHFWVLALKYSKDYDKGGFPTLPVAKGHSVTREQITLWCLAYAALGLLSALFFPIGTLGVVGSLLVSVWLLFELVKFLMQPEQKTWLRFFLSINFSMIMYLAIIMGDLLFVHFQS